MKKNFYPLFAAATMLFAASCSQDEEIVSGSAEQSVTFTVQVPASNETRAIADGVNVGEGNMANTLVYALYEKGKTNETPLILGQKEEDTDGVFVITVPMAKDLTYELMMLAYNEGNCAFDVNYKAGDLTSVNLQALKLKSSLSANQEAYDAFVGSETVSVNEEAVTIINLKRPFAQVNAATTSADLADAETLKAVVTSSQLVIEDVPTVYNVFTGEATSTADLTYSDATILYQNGTKNNEVITVDGTTYNYLTMAYVLAGETATSDKSTHNATFTFNREDGTTVSTLSVANLPIQRNYRTNVVGGLLTKTEGYQVVIDAEFSEPATAVSYWDGKTYTEPAKENGAYVVRSAAEFAWLTNYSNTITRAGTSLTGTIEIAADLNMGGYEISGITAARSGELTINGNGYTISNAIVVSGDNDNGTSSASLFVCLPTSTLNINKLNVEEVSVVTDENAAHGYAGVIAAYVEGTLNLTEVNVLNSSVHSTQSIGGMLGFVAANGIVSIKDCTVDGVKLTNADVADESGAMGGLVGRVAAATLTVENTTVSNSTIDAYVGTAKDQKRSISKYIGNFVGGGTINVTNGVIENVTINAKNELAKTQSCLYGDFLGGWRADGGTVTINGVNIEKDNNSIVTTAEQLATALTNAQDGDVIGIGASIATKSLDASGKNITLVGMTDDAGIDASTSGFSTWSANITAKNLTIKSHSSVDYYSTGINCSGNITFENCEFEGIATAMNGNFVYNNCTFTNTTKGKYAAWVYSGKATYNNCTFNGVDRAVKVYTEAGVSATATYESCTFNSETAKKAAVEIDATNNNGKEAYYTVNINNATVNGMAKGEFTGNVHCNIEGTNANVFVDGVKVIRAILIGNTAYASLDKAIAAAQSGEEIVLADGTYEGLFSCAKSLVLSAADGAKPVIDGMLFVSDAAATVKANGLTFTDVHEQTLTYGLHAKVNNSCVGIYAGAVELENCVFDITGEGNYGIQSYSNVTLTVKNCTFNCNGQRPIANNGPATTVTGCTFNNQYQYALRIKENGGNNQTVVFENNTIAGETTKTPVEGINISKLGGSATVLADFTIKGNTEGLAYRHHEKVTMSADCTYDTDIENFAFVSE